MVYPLYLLDGGNEIALELNIYQITVSATNTTTASITIHLQDPTDCASFGYKVVSPGTAFTSTGLTFTNMGTGYTHTFSVTGLTAGTEYEIQARGYSSANGSGTYGGVKSTRFTMPKTSTDSGITDKPGTESDSSPTPYRTDKNIYYNYYNGTWVDSPEKIVPYTSNPKSSTDTDNSNASNNSNGNTSTTPKPSVDSIKTLIEKSTKSFLKLSNEKKDTDLYTVSYKSFPKLDITQSYFAFGTSIYFEANIEKPTQSGGIGFFLDATGKDGYFLNIKSTSLAAVGNTNEYVIYKVKGGKSFALPDNITGGTTKISKGVYGGQIYKVDIKVKYTSTQVDIEAYINGFKITATDKNPTSAERQKGAINILPKTNKIGLRCQQGVIYFDYVYGIHMGEKQYQEDQLFNLYNGQFSNATISFLYGNTTLQNQSLETLGGFLEEFGPVAREIKYLNTRYESAPSFPLYASVGINPYAQVIGERLTSYNAKVFVVNNTGTTIPLDDSNTYSFFIVGKYINLSSTIEYTDNFASEFDVQEPVQFESIWLQKQSDVKALGDWIKSIWSKKNIIVQMNVFGNPLLSVGDIITINYPYNDLYHTGVNQRKFVVTKINHKFEGGLDTTITARTL